MSDENTKTIDVQAPNGESAAPPAPEGAPVGVKQKIGLAVDELGRTIISFDQNIPIFECLMYAHQLVSYFQTQQTLAELKMQMVAAQQQMERQSVAQMLARGRRG